MYIVSNLVTMRNHISRSKFCQGFVRNYFITKGSLAVLYLFCFSSVTWKQSIWTFIYVTSPTVDMTSLNVTAIHNTIHIFSSQWGRLHVMSSCFHKHQPNLQITHTFLKRKVHVGSLCSSYAIAGQKIWNSYDWNALLMCLPYNGLPGAI